MTESIVMQELREIRDKNSARHLKMTREEIEKEWDETTEWFIKKSGKNVKIANSCGISKTEIKTVDYICLFFTEMYNSFLEIPDNVRQQTDGNFTPFNFFKVMVKADIQAVGIFGRTLAEYIGIIAQLGIPISDLAEKANADPEDLQAFYEKFHAYSL